MKHSDAIKSMLLATINEIASDPQKYAAHPGKDFTRNRKMGFNDTILMLLTMEADCIKEELYRYFGRNTNAPSKAAFYKQRKKLNEEALANLLYMPAMDPQLISSVIPMTRIPSSNQMGNLLAASIRFISTHSILYSIGGLQIS